MLPIIDIADSEIVASPKRKPLVSIMLITYNHEKFIGQTLESILMQETEYDYEINVIEDCSTDRTQEVVMSYVERYPQKVIPYFNRKNIGNKITQKNFYQGYFRLTGDYMAIIEGDDYWSSPHKLQKQISFLEANPEYVACSHNVIKTYEDNSSEPHRFLYWPMPSDNTIEDLILLRSYFHITTLMFRNVFKGKPPLQFSNRLSCEIFVAIAHAQYGKVRYFDEDMSVYRAHGGGRFSTMSLLDGWFFNIDGLRRYNQWLRYRYVKTFARSIVNYCNVLLSDKGKQADLPTRYQYLKYFAIRTVYQIIFVIWSVPGKLNYILTKLLGVFRWIFMFDFQLKLRTIQLFFSRTIKLFFLQSIQYFFSELLLLTYKIINKAMPVFLREYIKKLEASHVSIKFIRVAIIQKKILTKEGIRMSVNAISVAAYKAMRLVLPEFVKKILKSYEATHPKLKAMRELVLQGKMFTRS